MKRCDLAFAGMLSVITLAQANNAISESLSTCEDMFSTPGHSTEILGVEPIAGNALQAILPTESYDATANRLFFGSTTIEYFNPATGLITNVPMKANSSYCRNTFLRPIADLVLTDIHFQGLGIGGRSFSCFIGLVRDDVVTHQTRPMVICSDEYTEGVVESSLMKEDVRDEICTSSSLREYYQKNNLSFDTETCKKNLETAARAAGTIYPAKLPEGKQLLNSSNTP